ncbi:MAG TPA: regulatory iron-sulfur-containing complex subunit RicT [Chthonomonadales bacterium]|nr:regulatory iron-sulfur-containing complex subunit RicT [Chthonomonadales bacterium]
MPVVVGVVLRPVTTPYWFEPGGLDAPIGSRVVVETARGIELGTVRLAPREVPAERLAAPLRPVLRLAGAGDLEQERRNRERAAHALEYCAEQVRRLDLPMKLLQSEYTFDGSQVTIYFAADNRVDFRELVKELAAHLRCKIQLYQVGARDHAKIIGGLGPCGLGLCCATCLTEFAPVSMKMAKDQSLFLNPTKFSGVCGKLLCCLRYEHDHYVDVRARLPQVGQHVATPQGPARVLDINLMKEEAIVSLLDTEAQLSFSCADMAPLDGCPHPCPRPACAGNNGGGGAQTDGPPDVNDN